MANKHANKIYRRISRPVREAALIEATLVCLRKYGHTGVSVRRISHEAGVSVGLVNHYFPQKAGLVATAYEKLSISLLQSYQKRIEDESLPPQKRLSLFFEAWFAPDQLTPEMFKIWLVFWGTASAEVEMRSAYKQMRRLYRINLERLLGQLSRHPGIPRFEVRPAAIGLSGLLDGLWLQLSLDHSALKPSEAICACNNWVRALCVGAFPQSSSRLPPPSERRIKPARAMSRIATRN